MTNSNPFLTRLGLRSKPAYQPDPEPQEPAAEQPAPVLDTPLAPPWPTHPVANRLYAENQMFIDQASAACERAARRGY